MICVLKRVHACMDAVISSLQILSPLCIIAACITFGLMWSSKHVVSCVLLPSAPHKLLIVIQSCIPPPASFELHHARCFFLMPASQARALLAECVDQLDKTKSTLVDIFVDLVNESKASVAPERAGDVSRMAKANTAALAMVTKLEEKCAAMKACVRAVISIYQRARCAMPDLLRVCQCRAVYAVLK
jgi:hypothetical protein